VNLRRPLFSAAIPRRQASGGAFSFAPDYHFDIPVD